MYSTKQRIIAITAFTLMFSSGAYVIGQIDKTSSTYSWATDQKQSSLENINVVSDFFWNKGESLQRFLIKSTQCAGSTDWSDMKVSVSSVTYDYRYACNDDGYYIVVGKDFETIARTMNKFQVSEKYGKDVSVTFWEQTYTFDAAGYKQSVLDSDQFHKGL
ncbi:hypothetical protein AB6D16_023750 [Vibrio cyclitrophicus]|uniref:hypothetical protein n=1 Tax=Vibrio sp. 10N.261.55.A10 TaxID=3229687 RepID=UPI00354B4B91